MVDIGSEISQKIQLAIKAKLVEINAYVDNELPDYIMIMIANRKAEDQMTEALSLFLGNNTKTFTKWLYELLSSLREKPAQKVDNEEKKIVIDEVNTEVRETDRTEDQKAGENSETLIKNDGNKSSKASRWDVKKHVKKLSHDTETPEKAVTDAKENVVKEDVIDILPEKDDLFDEELLADIEDISEGKFTSKLATEISKKSSTTVCSQNSIEKGIHAKESVAKEHKVKSSQKKDEKKHLDKKRKNYNVDNEKEPVSSSNSGTLAESKKLVSSHKRTVAVKTSKAFSTRVSTSDKDFSTHFAPPKHKKKKVKKSAGKESPQTSHKEKSSKTAHVREWDRDKGKEQLSYTDRPKYSRSESSSKPKRLAEESDGEEVPPKKVVSSVVSSTVSAVSSSQYVSDESDEEADRKYVISRVVTSKIAVPQRRSRLPPSQQANRSLLLKAVSEAESSIKKHQSANKMNENLSEDAFKTKVELHKKLALGNVLDARRNIRSKEKITTKLSSRLLRETKLLKPESQRQLSKEVTPRSKAVVKRKSIDAVDLPEDKSVDKTTEKKKLRLSRDDENYQAFGDSRRIVSRDNKSDADKPNKSTVQKHEVVSGSSKQIDSQKIPMEASSKSESLASGDDEDEVTTKDKAEDAATTKKTTSLKKKRSPSPCFIVTLDGKSNQAQKDYKESPKKFRPTPITAPMNDVTLSKEEVKSPLSNENKLNQDHKTISKTPEVPIKKETSDNAPISDLELSEMREKLLKMQENAKKLKEVQLKQQALIKQKLNSDKSLPNPDLRSIHIANVHFSANEKQISEHFSICGKVLRVTILRDPFTGHPKGFAYLEFEEESCVETAMALNGTTFCGRKISVSKKETDAAKRAVTPPSRRFYTSGSHRYPARRMYKRYNTRYTSLSRSLTQSTLSRNRTWVKPGYST